IAGKHQARLRFRPGAEPELDERPSDASDSSLTFSLRERRSLVEIGHVHARRALLRSRGSRASTPVYVDGIAIDRAPVPDAVAVRDHHGRTVAHAGWSDSSVDAATLIFVANGLIIETQRVSDWLGGFTAVIEAGDLERDLSQLKLVRNQAFAQRVALVRSVHDHLPTAPVRYEGPGEQLMLATRRLWRPAAVCA